MEKIILKPSTKAYDGMNSIEEIMGEYNGYLSVISDKDLKTEFDERKSDFLSSPTIMNVRMFKRSKEKMLDRGLISQNQNQNYMREMWIFIEFI